MNIVTMPSNQSYNIFAATEIYGEAATMRRNTKKIILIFLSVILLTSFVLVGCGGSETVEEAPLTKTTPEAQTTPQSTATTPAQTTPPAANQSSFETVGMFDNSPAMVAISYYVTNPTKADITDQCAEMKKRFIDGNITTNLRISFFDDRANTPDYAGGYDIPEASQAAEVANYYYNALNGSTDLRFLKPIP